MVEALVATAVALVLLAYSAGGGMVQALYVCGAWAVALGLAAGVPAGVVYHVRLHRALRAAGAVEPGWWWDPTRYHGRLTADRRRAVMPWFRAGAAGFLAAIAGCALVLAAVLAQ